MPAHTPSSPSLIGFTAATICCTALSWLAVCAWPFLDNIAWVNLLHSFGANSPTLVAAVPLSTWLQAGGIVNLIFMAALSACAITVTLKLPPGARLIAAFTLVSLALLEQWGMYNFLHVTPRPVGFAAALVCGIMGGAVLRNLLDQHRQLESNYYALQMQDKELADARLLMLARDEIDRRTLAGDLHDQVLNDLKKIAQRFDRFVETRDAQQGAEIRKLLDDVTREVREVMDSLSPSVLEHLGLPAAVEDCLRQGAQRSGFKLRFKNTVPCEDLDKLSSVEQVLLYRLAQEAITNACKHAGASMVRVTLAKEEGSVLLLRIVDDGKGLPAQPQLNESRGLKYMQYRANLIGATIKWLPGDDGKGTAVEIRFDMPVISGVTAHA